MNKEQLDNLALQCWGGDLVCYKYFDHHKFLALVDAERAKEQEPDPRPILREIWNKRHNAEITGRASGPG